MCYADVCAFPAVALWQLSRASGSRSNMSTDSHTQMHNRWEAFFYNDFKEEKWYFQWYTWTLHAGVLLCNEFLGPIPARCILNTLLLLTFMILLRKLDPYTSKYRYVWFHAL